MVTRTLLNIACLVFSDQWLDVCVLCIIIIIIIIIIVIIKLNLVKPQTVFAQQAVITV